MTIDQAKELMRISRTKTRRVKLQISQSGHPIAYIKGKLYYHDEHKLWLVNGSHADAGILMTDTIKIARTKNYYLISLKLTGKRSTYAKAQAHVPVVEAVDAIIKEANNEQC